MITLQCHLGTSPTPWGQSFRHLQCSAIVVRRIVRAHWLKRERLPNQTSKATWWIVKYHGFRPLLYWREFHSDF